MAERNPLFTKLSTKMSMTLASAGPPLDDLAEDRLRERIRGGVGWLLVQRLVRELRGHRVKPLVGTLAELPVREDVEVVLADALEHALATLAGIHPER